MSEDKRARLKQWLESGEAVLQPATFPQRELWAASPVPAGDVSNHICTITTVKGTVSREFCEKAMAMVVDKQEVLRLSILPGKNGPVQLVRKTRKPSVHFHEVDAAKLDEAELDDFIVELIRQPFDLVGGPLYRVEVLRRSPTEHLLVLIIHHAIADGWTLGVFMTDLWSAYALLTLGLPGGLDPVPQSYTDWGAAERAFWDSRQIRSRKGFWRERLAGANRLFDGSVESGERVGRRGRWVAMIEGELIERLKAFAGKNGATLFSTVLSAFQLVMSAATGKEDILVGSPVANRSKKRVWDTMGSFAGIVPMRGRVDRERPFVDQLAETHEMTVDCLAHAIPFIELVKCLEEPVVAGRNPVFDVRFALQNHPVPEVSMPDMEVDYRTRSTGTCRFDLACELTEIGSKMEVVWLFREDMFSPEKVESFHQGFASLLENLCDRADDRVVDLIESLL